MVHRKENPEATKIRNIMVEYLQQNQDKMKQAFKTHEFLSCMANDGPIQMISFHSKFFQELFDAFQVLPRKKVIRRGLDDADRFFQYKASGLMSKSANRKQWLSREETTIRRAFFKLKFWHRKGTHKKNKEIQ
eukprot:6239032-Karenia_brevis.AAC.1